MVVGGSLAFVLGWTLLSVGDPPPSPLVSPLPPEIGIGNTPPPSRQRAPRVLFVNFDGADMRGGCGDRPSNNCSTIHAGTVDPFPGDRGQRASIIQNLRRRLAAYAVDVTWERPRSGDYDMEMVGTWGDQTPPGVAGIAPSVDCWDERGGETSFTLLVEGSTDGIAEIILQELAHTWGLSHVDDVRDLLYPTTAGSSKTFREECLPIVSDADLTPGTSGCTHHEMACGSDDQQSSHLELLMILGESVADTRPPRVDIRRPGDGSITFPDVSLDVELSDDRVPAIMEVTVELEGLAEVTDNYVTPDRYSFPLSGLPVGEHRVVVTARDESGNESSDEIRFVVDPDGPPPEPGCGCATPWPARPGSAGLAALALLPALGRRRVRRG